MKRGRLIKPGDLRLAYLARAHRAHAVMIRASGEPEKVEELLSNTLDYDHDLIDQLTSQGYVSIVRTALEDAETLKADVCNARRVRPSCGVDLRLYIMNPAGHLVSAVHLSPADVAQPSTALPMAA